MHEHLGVEVVILRLVFWHIFRLLIALKIILRTFPTPSEPSMVSNSNNTSFMKLCLTPKGDLHLICVCSSPSLLCQPGQVITTLGVSSSLEFQIADVDSFPLTSPLSPSSHFFSHDHLSSIFFFLHSLQDHFDTAILNITGSSFMLVGS